MVGFLSFSDSSFKFLSAKMYKNPTASFNFTEPIYKIIIENTKSYNCKRFNNLSFVFNKSNQID